MNTFKTFDSIDFHKSLAHPLLYLHTNLKSSQLHHVCIMLITKFIDVTFFPKDLYFLLSITRSGTVISKFFTPYRFRLIILYNEKCIYDSDYLPGLLKFILTILHEIWSMVEEGYFDQLNTK